MLTCCFHKRGLIQSNSKLNNISCHFSKRTNPSIWIKSDCVFSLAPFCLSPGVSDLPSQLVLNWHIWYPRTHSPPFKMFYKSWCRAEPVNAYALRPKRSASWPHTSRASGCENFLQLAVRQCTPQWDIRCTSCCTFLALNFTTSCLIIKSQVPVHQF